jgi:hypothetical protein
MTTARERTQALIFARAFLNELQFIAGMPGVPKKIKDEARDILRHYPEEFEIRRIAEQTEKCSAVPLLSSKLD